MPKPRISAKDRREMDAEIDALTQAAKDLNDLFRLIAPYIAIDSPEKLPYASWTPNHWGLLIANMGGTSHDAQTFERWKQFDAVRENPVFSDIFARARAGRDRALEAFRAAGGERLLGS